jgi:hypothetical protein
MMKGQEFMTNPAPNFLHSQDANDWNMQFRSTSPRRPWATPTVIEGEMDDARNNPGGGSDGGDTGTTAS